MVPVKHMACLRKFLRDDMLWEFISEDIKFQCPPFKGESFGFAKQGDVYTEPVEVWARPSKTQVGLYASIFGFVILNEVKNLSAKVSAAIPRAKNKLFLRVLD